jgi:hypothetical protein
MLDDEEATQGKAEGDAPDIDVAVILATYRAKKMREHMIGPSIAFVLHVLALVLLALFVKGKPVTKDPSIEVVIEEVEIVELEEPQIEEIEDVVEEEFTDTAPSFEVEAPTPTETTEAALEDVSDEAPESDDDLPDFEEVLDVKVNLTPLKIAGILGGRRSAGNTGGGAPGPANRSVDSSLAWLAKMQKPEGTWPFDAHPNAVQAACTLAFLGRGHTTTEGKYRTVVRKSLDNFIGRIRQDGALGNHGHATPFVAMAICDAFAMEPDNKKLAKAATGFVNYAMRTQLQNGGWNGGSRKAPLDSNAIDVAQTGW